MTPPDPATLDEIAAAADAISTSIRQNVLPQLDWIAENMRVLQGQDPDHKDSA